MVDLDDYGELERLYSSGRTLVLRGKRDDGVPVVVKTVATASPLPEEADGLVAEFRIGSSLDHPNLMRHLELVHDGLRPALVMEDVGGAPCPRSSGRGPWRCPMRCRRWCSSSWPRPPRSRTCTT